MLPRILTTGVFVALFFICIVEASEHLGSQGVCISQSYAQAGADIFNTLSTVQLGNEIKKLYGIDHQEDCVFWVSKDQPLPTVNDNYEIAAVIAGFKPVCSISSTHFLNIDVRIRTLLSRLDCPIRYFTVHEDAYFCASDKEKDAYMLAKLKLESMLIATGRDKDHTINKGVARLIGLSYGYPEAAIDFFECRMVFLAKTGNFMLSRVFYQSWPEKIKHLFDEYENSAEAQSLLITSRISAQEWLRNHTIKSVEELRADICSLEQRLTVAR